MGAEMLSATTYLVRPPKQPENATFCVLSSPRGGSSMIAGLLRAMGVAMSNGNLDPANNEDRDFLGHNGIREIFELPERADEARAYIETIKTLAQKRDSTFLRWGWKDPIAVWYIEKLLPCLRNPHIVLLTRDPACVGFHEFREFGDKNPCLDNITMASLAYAAGVRIIQQTEYPAIVVSYEKALLHPADVIDKLGAFCGYGGFNKKLLSGYIAPSRDDGRILPEAMQEALRNNFQ